MFEPRDSARAVVTQDEDGAWCAEVPTMPGCFSSGQSREEAMRNIEEAAAAWL